MVKFKGFISFEFSHCSLVLIRMMCSCLWFGWFVMMGNLLQVCFVSCVLFICLCLFSVKVKSLVIFCSANDFVVVKKKMSKRRRNNVEVELLCVSGEFF